MTDNGGVHIHAPPARGYQAYIRYRYGRWWLPLLSEATEDRGFAIKAALDELPLPRVVEVKVFALYEYYDSATVFHAKRLK